MTDKPTFERGDELERVEAVLHASRTGIVNPSRLVEGDTMRGIVVRQYLSFAFEQGAAQVEETRRLQLAAIDVIAGCNTTESLAKQRIDRDNPYWTPAYESVVRAVEREIQLRDRPEKPRCAATLLHKFGAQGVYLRCLLDEDHGGHFGYVSHSFDIEGVTFR